jgi:hypothetical protein
MSGETVGSLTVDAADIADARAVLSSLRKEYERSGGSLPKWLLALCGVVDLIWRAQPADSTAAHDGGAEPPQSQPQPVTREEFDRVANMANDSLRMIDAALTARVDALWTGLSTLEERVDHFVERLREHSELLASLNLPKLREECYALAAGGDLLARVAALEKLTEIDAWRQLAAAHAETARELRACIAKLSSAP